MKDRLEDTRERLKFAKDNWIGVNERELVCMLMFLVDEIKSLNKRIDKLEPKPLSEGLQRLQEDIEKGKDKE